MFFAHFYTGTLWKSVCAFEPAFHVVLQSLPFLQCDMDDTALETSPLTYVGFKMYARKERQHMRASWRHYVAEFMGIAMLVFMSRVVLLL